MGTIVELNENERKVLKALEVQMQECTGGEFGYISDADKCGLSKNEFAGYISALKAKGMFEYLDTANGDYNGQYALTEDAVQLATN